MFADASQEVRFVPVQTGFFKKRVFASNIHT
jgi:hypothetical protein